MADKKKNKQDIVRSSAAEYLTFIASHGEGGIEVVYADENIWLTQKMMGGALQYRNPYSKLSLEKNICRQ